MSSNGPHRRTSGAERGLNRFEGFSDAVFAIALTLLIVEIKVPGSPDGPQGYSDLVQAMAGMGINSSGVRQIAESVGSGETERIARTVFVLRRVSPFAARAWLGCALVAGLLLGLAQQQRGAHYMSHTLWTAWLCWTTGFVADAALRLKYAGRDSLAGGMPKLNES